MNTFFLYILKCSDGSYYVGHTDNLEARIAKHQEGQASAYTGIRLPVNLVYTEEFATRTEVLIAERKLKKWSRAKKEIVIYKGWAALKGWKSKLKT